MIQRKGVCPSLKENRMRETRSNAKSPMRVRPAYMTVSVKHKGGK